MGINRKSDIVQPVASDAGCIHGGVQLQVGQGLVLLEKGRQDALESSFVVGW